MCPKPLETSEKGLKLLMLTDKCETSNDSTGEFYLTQFNDPKQSRNVLDLAINAFTREAESSDSPEIQAKMARAYVLNGQPALAEKIVRKIINRYPVRFHGEAVKKALEVASFIHFRKGKLEQAKLDLLEALRLEKPWKTAKIHLGLAGIYMEQAKTCFNVKTWAICFIHLVAGTILTPFSKSLPQLRLELGYQLVTKLLRMRPAEEALDTYLKLYKKLPGHTHIPVEIGKLYQGMARYSDAEFWFSRAIERHPSRDEGYHHLVNLYRVTQNTASLVDVLQRWLAIRPESAEIMSALSMALADNPDHYDEAFHLAKSAMAATTNPKLLAGIYSHLGFLYSNIQNIDSAILSYQAALNLQPENLDIAIQLGTLYHEKQEYQLSQKIFERALALSPNNARILCNLGYLFWMQGDIRQSQEYYERSIAIDPTYDIALNNLGVLYLDHIGDIEQAMYLFDQTLIYNPNYALCHYNRGRAFSFLGKTIEAARCFSQAQDLNISSQELDHQELADRIKSLFENDQHLHYTDM